MVTIYLVTGPPASGKTTWVRERAQPGDITIDYDTIAEALATATDPRRPTPQVRKVTKAARQAAIDAALTLTDCDVYLIHAMPSQALITRYERAGAHIITIDPGPDVVLARCKAERPWRMAQAAKEWYAQQTASVTPANTAATSDLSRQW